MTYDERTGHRHDVRPPAGFEPAWLDDYVDGRLDDAARAELERHVEACAPCRMELRQLRALLSHAAALPAAIEPPDAIWHAVRPALAARPRRSVWRSRGARWSLLAAALLAVAGAIVVGTTGRARSVAQRPPAAIDAPSRVAQTQRTYGPAIAELTSTLAGRRATLSPRTLATVDESVAVIDRAIAELESAVARDPGNPVLLDLLAITYEQKLSLLRRAASLGAES